MSTYYTIPESVTSRIDIDPDLKWVITNIHNKLQIPPERLKEARYTFSVGNVAKEMGLRGSTAFYRFQMLAEMKVLKELGPKRTSHGTVVIYEADGAALGKLLSGEITVPKGLLKKVREKKNALSAGDEPASSETEIAASEAEEASSPADIRISPAETSNQIEYSNSSIQKVAFQTGTEQSVDWNMAAYQKELDKLSDPRLKRLVATEILNKLRVFRENGLGSLRPPFEDFLKQAKIRLAQAESLERLR